MNASNRSLLPLAIVGTWAFLLCFGILKLQGRWWFEDDPMQLFAVSKVSNPIEFFTSQILIRSFGTGQGFYPMLFASFWLDTKLAPLNPIFAYAHTVIIFLAIAGLLYSFLNQLTRNSPLSIAMTILWTILPSTLATLQFLSTRHYLEGLGWTLALLLLLTQPANRTGAKFWMPLIFFSVAGMLSKEIYATLIPTILFCYGVSVMTRERIVGRQFAAKYLFASLSLIVLYAGYRISMVGTGLKYQMALPTAKQFLAFIAYLPFTLTVGQLGLYWVTLLTLCTALNIVRAGRVEVIKIGLGALCFASVLVALFPVATALLETYQTPGTWYRIAFLPNTLLIVHLGYLLPKLLADGKLLLVCACFGLTLVPGSLQTVSYWTLRTNLQAIEGQFYLSHPTRLLYSTQEAYWFIVGIHKLYGVPKEHYILKYAPEKERDLKLAREFPEVWALEGDHLISSRSLRNQLITR